jgi:hypothetical protein
VEAAKAMTSDAWREGQRGLIQATKPKNKLSTTPEHLEDVLRLFQTHQQDNLVRAMGAIGGPEVVAHCLSLAESDATPPSTRRAALSALKKAVPPDDTATATRRDAAFSRLIAARGGKPPSAEVFFGSVSVAGGTIANASSVVAGMAAGFRRCANKALSEEDDLSIDPGFIKLTATVGPKGEVLSVTPSGTGVSEKVLACMSARVSSALFAPPDSGSATVTIPVSVDVREPKAKAGPKR